MKLGNGNINIKLNSYMNYQIKNHINLFMQIVVKKP